MMRTIDFYFDFDVPWARERFKSKPDDFFIAPAAIADEAWHIANQPRSAWSFKDRKSVV